jgi:hypothetical protein
MFCIGVKFQFSHYGNGTARGGLKLGAEEKFIVKKQTDSVTDPVITSYLYRG